MSVPFYHDDTVTLHHGDCLDVLRAMPDASVDAVVTDPPYGIRFMGRAWDGADIEDGISARRKYLGDPSEVAGENGGYRSAAVEAGRYDRAPSANAAFQEWCELWATECLRVLKPGGHLLAFGGSRTWHRLACAVEDAGFEMRDSIAWLYGSGFPKSLDVSKAIDKAEGVAGTFGGPKTAAHAEQLATGKARRGAGNEGWERPWMDDPEAVTRAFSEYLPGSEAGRAYKGWGTALKPAFEPIVVARKPLDGTVAANVLKHGVGGINVDGCRVGAQPMRATASAGNGVIVSENASMAAPNYERVDAGERIGRWPPNVILDQSQAAEVDRQSGVSTGKAGVSTGIYGDFAGHEPRPFGYDDSGGAARFFPTFRYEAKAPSSERPKAPSSAKFQIGEALPDYTVHPTVKPVDLMRWLVRLVTPPGGIVLDPFAGSGTTAEACIVEGFRCILIEKSDEYLPLIVQRLTKPIQPTLDMAVTR